MNIESYNIDILCTSQLIKPIETGSDLIPADTVIREFIGGSTIQIPHNE